MLSIVRLAIYLGVGLLYTQPASADEFIMQVPEHPSEATVQILGGKQADPDVWPVTRVFVSGRWGCTATAIGPQIILTAAHCIKDTPKAKFQSGIASVSVDCTSYPGWIDKWLDPMTTYDVALCLAKSGKIPLGTDEKYERVNLSPGGLPAGVQVVLLGYGCTENDDKGGVLYEGSSIAGNTDFGAYITTKVGGAQFCPGDSGGAVYRETSPYTSNLG